jgi:hypothetical protein
MVPNPEYVSIADLFEALAKGAQSPAGGHSGALVLQRGAPGPI